VFNQNAQELKRLTTLAFVFRVHYINYLDLIQKILCFKARANVKLQNANQIIILRKMLHAKNAQTTRRLLRLKKEKNHVRLQNAKKMRNLPQTVNAKYALIIRFKRKVQAKKNAINKIVENPIRSYRVENARNAQITKQVIPLKESVFTKLVPELE